MSIADVGAPAARKRDGVLVMRESRQTFWVGLFVLVGLGALAVLIVMFGKSGLLVSRGEYVLNVRFDRAPGVRVGPRPGESACIHFSCVHT